MYSTLLIGEPNEVKHKERKQNIYEKENYEIAHENCFFFKFI